MSRKGNCWDNAVMERFFRSLKTERLNYQSFANHYEVVQNVESYIYFYNYKRIHSAILKKRSITALSQQLPFLLML
jgi:transposase InsO family protein